MTAEFENFSVKEILVDFRRQTLEALAHQQHQLDRLDREGSVGTREQLDDHESRIRANERARIVVWTLAILIIVLLPVITTLAWHVWGPH